MNNVGSIRYCLVNGSIITPARKIPKGGILIEQGKIAEVFPMSEAPNLGNTDTIDVHGDYVCPGFIDIHSHGGGGADVMDGDPEAFKTIARAHACGGTTCYVATTEASSTDDLIRSIAAFDQVVASSEVDGARLVGLHLEGPYFSDAQKGAQDPRYIKAPDREEYLGILESTDSIMRISAAPELPGGLELGRELRNRGIVASIGHSDATYDEVLSAIDAGYSHVTHLYSGTSGVKRVRAYRVAGVIESALMLDDLTVEIIADGKHLPGSLLKLIYKCKGPDRVALCTDAMRAAGMPEGEYLAGGEGDERTVVVDEGVAWMPDRTAFAGSVALANQLVRNMVELAGVGLPDAVRMASLTPAKIMRLDDSKGSLDKGKDADIVVLNKNLDVRMTIVEGRVVYRS